MQKNSISLKAEEIETVDGKVIISSEELAAAIQERMVELDSEEEAGDFVIFQYKCGH